MDVDRISGVGGIGQEQTPSWTREKMRRQKFVTEVPPEEESEAEETTPGRSSEDHDCLLDVIA
jgi:hypothetical protein